MQASPGPRFHLLHLCRHHQALEPGHSFIFGAVVASCGMSFPSIWFLSRVLATSRASTVPAVGLVLRDPPGFLCAGAGSIVTSVFRLRFVAQEQTLFGRSSLCSGDLWLRCCSPVQIFPTKVVGCCFPITSLATSECVACTSNCHRTS